jgi:glycosyltransferase involved in cell wall biosynthesis
LALVIAKPTSSSQGVAVLTHKEARQLLLDYAPRLWRARTSPSLSRAQKRELRTQFNSLRDRYVFGVHIGGTFQDTPPFIPLFDFALAPRSVLQSDLGWGSCHRIELSSKNFIPDDFWPRAGPRYFDFLCIANNRRGKRIEDFLEAVRTLYDEFPRRTLLISPERRNEAGNDAFWQGLEGRYEELFTWEERQSFVLLRPGPYNGFAGLPKELIADIFSRSSVFCLFSSMEGGPKVVYEALLSGCVLCVPSDQGGSAPTDLSRLNSVIFDRGNEASAMLEALTLARNYEPDLDDLRSRFSHEDCVRLLKDSLREIFGAPFEYVALPNLHLRLPAHSFENMPWLLGPRDTAVTADLVTAEDFSAFFDFLEMGEFS